MDESINRRIAESPNRRIALSVPLRVAVSAKNNPRDAYAPRGSFFTANTPPAGAMSLTLPPHGYSAAS